MATDGLIARSRERLRARHYSYQTEKAYLQWIARYVDFHDYRHPRELGAKDLEQFLTMLAVQRRVSASTQNQALAAILFLYREVLELDIPWVHTVVRAKRPQHLPVVLTRAEVERVLNCFSGTSRVIASLLYGSGLRVSEGLRLRVKDIDLEYRQIVVRDGKGRKDRVTVLPNALLKMLSAHLQRIRKLFDEDRARGSPGVSLPHALRRTYPGAARSLGG
jgi:integron integrase